MYLKGHWHYDRDHDHEVLVATINVQGDPIIVTLTIIILITHTMVVIHWILKDNSRVSSPSSRCDGAFWSRKLLPHTRLRIIMMMMVMIMKIMIKLIMMLVIIVLLMMGIFMHMLRSSIWGQIPASGKTKGESPGRCKSWAPLRKHTMCPWNLENKVQQNMCS